MFDNAPDQEDQENSLKVLSLKIMHGGCRIKHPPFFVAHFKAGVIGSIK